MQKKMIILGVTFCFVILAILICERQSIAQQMRPKDIPVRDTINIDGKADDWINIPVFIQDIEGDVRIIHAGENVCEFDVKNIKFASNNFHLFIFIELANELNYYFKANKEYSKVVGTIFLDADNDKNTGGKEFFSKSEGFESKIEIWSGVKTKDGGLSVSGNAYLTDLPEGVELEYFIEYIPSKYNKAKDSLDTNFAKRVKSDREPALVNYSDNFIEFKIPFNGLNIYLENNKTIRVLFSEQGSGSWGQGKDTFSDEVIGIMKQ